MANEGNKHITSAGSEGSIRSRERREGWRGGNIKDKEGNIKQEKGKQKGTMGLDSESPVFFKRFQKEAHQKSTLSEK